MSLDITGTIGRGDFSLAVDLHISSGETLGLVGRNGSGKSTLLHTVAGLIPLTAGSISLHHHVWDSVEQKRFTPPEDRQCAVVFQDIRLFPHMTCVDNVAFGLRSHGIGRRDSRHRAHDMLTKVGAGELAQRRASGLSGGQAQRVALARALVLEPQVLLLDEPLSAVDATSRPMLRDLIAETLATFEGVSIVVSHDEADVTALAPRVLGLSVG